MNKIFFKLGVLMAAFPMQLFAQTVDPCAEVPGGCDAGAVPGYLTTGISAVANAFIALAAAAAIVFIIIGGAQMMLNFGDEGKAEKGKMTVIWALGGLALSLMAQTFVSFVVNTVIPYAQSDTATLSLMEAVVGLALAAFNTTFVLITIYCGYMMVLGRGSQDTSSKAKTMINWSIAGALTINVSAALVRAVFNIGL